MHGSAARHLQKIAFVHWTMRKITSTRATTNPRTNLPIQASHRKVSKGSTIAAGA
jgi:hypothetical protein